MLPEDRRLGNYVREGHLKQRWYISADEKEIYFVYHEMGEDKHDVFRTRASAYSTRFGR